MAKRYKQLFIGLGGQGAKSIREIRKVIYERELNVKANKNAGDFDLPCAFLSIDSSSDIVKEAQSSWVHLGKNLSLNAGEFCQLESNINVDARNIVPWLYSRDATVAREQRSVFSTINKSTGGAQQRRRYGRALFAANADKVYHNIVNAYNRVKAFDPENSCMINVFCSLGGGTGSGGIVDLVNLIRQKFPSSDTIGLYQSYPLNIYIYMADQNGVNPSDVQGFFFENQYAALRDINALATGVMHPHTLAQIESSNFYPGERNVSPNPINAVILSTNTTSENHRVSIEEQIKRVASWAVDRALIAEGAIESGIAKIASGEDFKAETHGEPNDVSDTFLERAYIFSNLGAAKWQSPINELSLMTVHSILGNSFRQMVYNNVTPTEGFKNTALPLEEVKKAEYIRFSPEDFLMTDYVAEGWQSWAANSAEIQALMTGAQNPQALRKMEEYFAGLFQNYVMDENTTAAGDYLSLPGRINKMMNTLKDRFGMANSSATNISDLLSDYVMQELVRNWKEGRIGLKQAQETVRYAADTALACVRKLESFRDAKQDDGAELELPLQSLFLRSDAKDGEWFKLTSLSYKLKGKAFLEAHLEDLIRVYTIRTQRGHLSKFIEQVGLYAENMGKFVKRLDTPIECMESLIKQEDELYTKAPLYRFIVKGDKPGKHEELLYDYDSRDPKVMDVVNYINGHNTPGSRKNTVVSNAKELRSLVAESISGGSTLAHLFGGNKAMNQRTQESLTSRAYELAGKMLNDADEKCGTKLMGGIVSRIEGMTESEFQEKFKRLMTSAAYSYLRDEATPSPSNGYGLSNAYREAWIVSFPKDITLPGIDSTPEARKAAILAVTPGASEQNVFVTESADTTQISVWQTEFARPARTAKVVRVVHERYKEMLKRGRIQDTFWMHIDDLAAEMAAPVTFPDKQELETIRDAALWFARNSEGAFSINEEQGDVYCNGSSADDRSLYNTKSYHVSDLTITSFAFDVQVHLRDVIREKPELLSTLKQKYEEALGQAERGSAEQRKMKEMISLYIKPTLFRIALKEGIKGVYEI